MEVSVISCKIIFVVNNEGKQEEMCLAYEIDDLKKTKRIVLVTHDSENKREEERSIIDIPVKLEVTGSASSNAAKYGTLRPYAPLNQLGDRKPAEPEGVQIQAQVISESDETATSHSQEPAEIPGNEKENEKKKGGGGK